MNLAQPDVVREALRVAVLLPSWVGDVVMSTPGLRALRASHPEGAIDAFVPPACVPLLAGSPFVDAVRPFAGRRAGIAPWVRDIARMRAGRYDLGLCVPDSVSSALSLQLAGVGRVVGHGRGLRDRLLDLAVAPDPAWGTARVVARERKVLHLLEALGVAPCGLALELTTTAAQEAGADRVLCASEGDRHTDGHASADECAPLAVLAPGASFGPAKLWPAASFARVGDALARAGARVVVTGSPAERSLAGRVVEEMEHSALDLCGRIDLGVLSAVLQRAALVVCNDAGARHIAVAVGTPAIVAMGPTDLAKTDCNLERVTVLAAEVECRPCYQRVCPIDHRCMTRLDPERAIDVALEILSGEIGVTGARH